MVDSIANVLVKRDGITMTEAEKQVEFAHKTLHGMIEKGEDPFDLCEDLFGLEPDYLEELL